MEFFFHTKIMLLFHIGRAIEINCIKQEPVEQMFDLFKWTMEYKISIIVIICL